MHTLCAVRLWGKGSAAKRDGPAAQLHLAALEPRCLQYANGGFELPAHTRSIHFGGVRTDCGDDPSIVCQRCRNISRSDPDRVIVLLGQARTLDQRPEVRLFRQTALPVLSRAQQCPNPPKME